MSELVLEVENVGGITRRETTLEPGVSLITGENASNKTSLLQALLFACGRGDVPIRTGADRATVTLTIDGRTVERTAVRTDDGEISIEGEPLIDIADNATLFARFAGLLADNPLRRSVQTNSNLETLLKEPMDIRTLERDRSEKLDRKRSIQERLDETANVDSEIETAEENLERRRAEAAELEATLSDLYEKVPDEDDELEELRQRRIELVSERERLREQIEDLTDARNRLDDTVAEAESELADARESAESFDLGRLRDERSRLREELEAIDERTDVLQSVLTVNKELLESDVQGVLEKESTLEGDRIECWACGQWADIGDFKETIEQLIDVVEQEKERRREHEPQLADIEDDISDGQEARRRISRLEQRLESVRSKRESRDASLAEKRERLNEIDAEFDAVEGELDAVRAERADDHVGLSEQIEETSVKLETKRQEIERMESELASLRDQREERDTAKEQLETLTTEIRGLTERIENLETDLRTGFNDAMDELIETLDFRDVDRMWLDGDFGLVVAREVDGRVQEDSVEHLAESERGMIGLVLGLAGYLAYDVADIAPVLVIDSLGVFDVERTQRLIKYFGEHTDYLVAAVHPEQVEDADSTLQQVRASTNPS